MLERGFFTTCTNPEEDEDYTLNAKWDLGFMLNQSRGLISANAKASAGYLDPHWPTWQ
jgi:hypothetical protein